MDLVSVVVNNKEPMKIIPLTYFETESAVMGFHVYRNNWRPVNGEVLKACIEPQNKVSKYAVAVVDNESNTQESLCQKGKAENMQKQYFSFWKLIPWTFATLKIKERL